MHRHAVIAVASFFGLVVLPAVLVSVPRGCSGRSCGRSAATIQRHRRVGPDRRRGRPAAVLAVAILVLAGLAAGLFGARAGLSPTEQFRTTVESVTGQEALARHFPAGSSQPVTVISASATTYAVPARVKTTDGQRDANLRDDTVIVPLILTVVLLVLVLLLRSLLAPVLLLLTVIASFVVSIGAATLVLRHLLGIPALDAAVPLLSFLSWWRWASTTTSSWSPVPARKPSPAATPAPGRSARSLRPAA